MTPVRFEPGAPWSRVKHSTTEPLRSRHDSIISLYSIIVVTFPTRLENTLDIFITNRPTQVSKCTSIPGLSDHDIDLTDTNFIPLRQKPPKRLVYLWKKQIFLVWKMTFISFQKPSPQSFLLILSSTCYGPPSRQRASQRSANMYPPK